MTRNERRSKRQRNQRRLDRTAVALLVALLLTVIGALVAIAAIHVETRPAASSPTAPPAPEYSKAQIENAAAIIAAGRSDHVPQRGIEIAVMTAMGESSLLNLEHGDEAGPDSIGLFQQRDIWGSRGTRLDPVASAHLFYKQLLVTPYWDQLTPTEAAHAVQINADPNHYTPYWERAVTLVQMIESRHSKLIERYA
ncbi:peptidase M23 [Curtobacterium sp. MCPF17_018]|nr:peptidase M23 [Curtobacterium sp. MCPF17_018]